MYVSKVKRTVGGVDNMKLNGMSVCMLELCAMAQLGCDSIRCALTVRFIQ